MAKNKTKVTIIIGPTSSGKTAYALSECKRVRGEIISFDSRQVFKGMDIGTGKLPVDLSIDYDKTPDHWIIDGINVWGYDLRTPDEYFSSFDFAEYAANKINELNNLAIPIYLVGGTGFYLDVLSGKIQLDSFAPDMHLRESLEKLNKVELLERLQKIDERRFQKIDKNNIRRILRAVENATVGLTNPQRNCVPSPLLNFEYEIIGFTAGNSFLYSRADAWCERVWKNGLLNECEILLKNFPKSLRLNGLIYKHAIAYIKGEYSDKEALEKMKFGVHAYIRRQMTWFRKYEKVTWFDISGK